MPQINFGGFRPAPSGQPDRPGQPQSFPKVHEHQAIVFVRKYAPATYIVDEWEPFRTHCTFVNIWAPMTKSRTIRWVLLLAALVVTGYFGWQRVHTVEPLAGAGTPEPAALAQAAAVPVTIAPVEKTDFPVYLTGLGTVQGFNTVVVRTRVDGQIDKIAFTEGQLVKQGDLLVQIDPRPFQAALDQAKAKKAQDEANLANANLDLQRYTKLGEFATRQQTDTQRSTVAQLTAQIAADDAAISNAQTQLDYTTVKAPISGVAGLRQVDVGNIVNASTQTGIVTIAQIEPIAVIFTAPEEQLPYINEAQSAQPLKVIALTTDGKKPLSEGVIVGGQQSGRHHQRHHPPQGGVRQQEPCAVAGPVGLDAAARHHAEGCHRRSRRRGPAWRRRPLRLRRQCRQQGRAAQDQGFHIDRRTLGGR